MISFFSNFLNLEFAGVCQGSVQRPCRLATEQHGELIQVHGETCPTMEGCLPWHIPSLGPLSLSCCSRCRLRQVSIYLFIFFVVIFDFMISSHHRLHCHWQPSHLVVNLMVEICGHDTKKCLEWWQYFIGKIGGILYHCYFFIYYWNNWYLLGNCIVSCAWAFSLVKVVNMLLIFSSRWKGVHQVAIRFSKLMVPNNYNWNLEILGNYGV